MVKILISSILISILFFDFYILGQNSASIVENVTERTIISDDLMGSTDGIKVGGSFNSEGYNPGIGNNHILYNVPSQIPNGYVEFEIKGFSHSSIPEDENHAFICLYDGRGINEPIGYYDDFKHNYFRWNVHWRQNQNAFKAVIAAADPTSARINSSLAVYEDQNGDGLDSHDRDWYTEPNGSGQIWDPNSWYTIKVQWKDKNFEIYVNDVKKWDVSGPNDYNPVDFKIWLGSGPDKYDSDMNVTYRNFHLVSFEDEISDYLSVSPTSKSLSASSGNFSANISSNINWSVNESLSWVSVSPQTGSGNESLAINYDQNLTSNERTGDIVITGGTFSRKITITQEGASIVNYLVLSPEADTVSADVVSTTFSINANVDWTISDTSSWANLDKLSGNGNSNIEINFSQNATTSERKTSFLIESSAGNEIFTLVQKGITIPGYLTLSPTNDTIDYLSGYQTLSLESNLEWSISDDAIWLGKSPSSGSGNQIITINYTANSDYEPRIANLTVIADTITKYIKIFQRGLPFEVSGISLPENAGSVLGTGNYYLGDSIIIKAIPNEGYRFVNFIEGDSVISTDSVYNFSINKHRTFTANFELVTSTGLYFDENPSNFSLSDNYPNPFNPTTKISYTIPKESNVTIKLYDMLGNFLSLIVDRRSKAGTFEVTFNAGNLSSGVYYYQMKADNFITTKRLVLLK